MNVLIKLILIMNLILFNIGFVFSFNVCNVEFSEPWFKVNDSDGNNVMIVDNDGDIYFRGEDHNAENKDTYESFEIGNMFFNKITSNFNLNNFNQKLTSLPSFQSLVFKDDNGNEIVKISSNEIYTKGFGAFEGSQANCLNDGNYCNSDLIENRDYFCNIVGDKSGGCDYNVISSVDCSTKPSIDSDGNDKWTRGTVTDFITCSSAFCTSNSYTDSCSTSSSVIEYTASGSSYNQNTVSCGSDYDYCSGLNVYHRNYYCGSGSCDYSTSYVDTCTAPSTSYGTWVCSSSTQKSRTNIEYEATCSGGACGVIDTEVTQTQNCNSGYRCYNGGSIIADYYNNNEAQCYKLYYNRWCYDNGITRYYTNSYPGAYHAKGCDYYGTEFYGTGTTLNDNGGTITCESSLNYIPDTNCISYHWKTGSWSSCSASCGGGTQTRDVWCEDSYGRTVSDSYCSGTKPATTQSCNTQSCGGTWTSIGGTGCTGYAPPYVQCNSNPPTNSCNIGDRCYVVLGMCGLPGYYFGVYECQ